MSTTLTPAIAPPVALRQELPMRVDRRPLWTRFLRGRTTDAPWVRPSFLALLVAAGALYLWGLGVSGWANAFYSAAVQAATKSWKAFFFGSFDSSNFITVDKPPASLWIMDLSARLFGVNAWSILVPQALEGVAAVALLYAAVRRWLSPAAGLLAGAVLALTPVAALMFRFNNPDALLTLLLVAGAYALTLALEKAGTRWLVLAGACVGFAFLTKMLQAFLVVPAFAGVYLLAAPTSLRRRVLQLGAAGLSLLVSAGWWVAIVTLVPASARPYIGGSQHNSVLELVFGYNGFGRLTGNETGSVGGGGLAGSRWGPTGWFRLFNADFGGQISWLIPAAMIVAAAVLWLRRGEPRTDRLRAAALMWSGWLLVTGAVFSFAQGIIHPYYSVALAPAIAALVGIGAVTLWQRRGELLARMLLAASVVVTVVWSFVLLGRSPTWLPWLRVGVLVLGLGSAVMVVVGRRWRFPGTAALAAAVLIATLAGPAAYSLETVLTPHTGAIPSAGPAVAASANGPGGAFGAGPPARVAGPDGFGQGAFAAPPALGFQPPTGAIGRAPGAGGVGGLLDASTPSSALVKLLQQNSSAYRWVAATVGSNSAAGIQLAAGRAVLSIGGFNGTDPTPTLAQFEQLVRAGEIHFFIAGGGGLGGVGGSSGSSSQIASWVTQSFTSTTVGGVTVYDLTSPATA